MILLLFAISTVSAAKLDAPAPYDPVWLASVQTYGPLPNETRLWGWVYEADVQFRLFTRRNPFDPEVLHINDSSSLHNSHFDFDNKVKILTHGWLNHGYSPMPESIKEVVDWGTAANVNYILASYNVAMVGRLLTQFLNFLIEMGVSMDDVHLIGHSLGAHVVGIAGAYVKKGPIDTITGLDPAYPLFTLGNKDARLDKHDARHVEVIHTCGGYLGFMSPLGHIDFYPNGGIRQPGCGYDIRGLCAHNRAHMFFSESIISHVPFTAVRCTDYDEIYYQGSCKGTGETLVMGGFDIHYGKDGIYYLKTNAEHPYALGDPT
ncbi:pancreatic lipase-related protein 2-like isoform X2 [Hyposmocoma kahamanoa]|uniref:pancreatic lipase-related protein 2-like isoform X2 n=1 Tax=Hyposmocoma kahamanoa TaxID=1477025 RepID=UPI000E6D781A|nr:pancreatic lipase-related protein 2-like isoform X2 [Hyposmocoma kahamanoa]